MLDNGGWAWIITPFAIIKNAERPQQQASSFWIKLEKLLSGALSADVHKEREEAWMFCNYIICARSSLSWSRENSWCCIAAELIVQRAAALSIQVYWGIIPISYPRTHKLLLAHTYIKYIANVQRCSAHMKYANQPFRFAVTFCNAFGINPFGSLVHTDKAAALIERRYYIIWPKIALRC